MLSLVTARRLLIRQIFTNTHRKFGTSNVKQSSLAPRWSYRRPPLPAKPYLDKIADGIGIVMWYWILYHCITQWEHLAGEWPYPDASKWTDEELGIPPEGREEEEWE
ncbi:UNVERIFIED_CONTAM: hypothetical protein RMT77_010649 [Armadillidium vulgare]